MNRRYYITPPTFDLPPFLKSRYLIKYLSHMIYWSKAEYTKAVVEASRHKAIKFVRFLHEEYSAMRILAESENFGEVLSLLNDENYNQLTGRERIFVRRAYELYVSLR